MLENLPQMHLKLLQKSNSKTAEVTGDLIGIKIVDVVAKSYGDKITVVSRNSPHNTSETEDIGFNAKMPKEI